MANSVSSAADDTPSSRRWVSPGWIQSKIHWLGWIVWRVESCRIGQKCSSGCRMWRGSPFGILLLIGWPCRCWQSSRATYPSHHLVNCARTHFEAADLLSINYWGGILLEESADEFLKESFHLTWLLVLVLDHATNVDSMLRSEAHTMKNHGGQLFISPSVGSYNSTYLPSLGWSISCAICHLKWNVCSWNCDYYRSCTTGYHGHGRTISSFRNVEMKAIGDRFWCQLDWIFSASYTKDKTNIERTTLSPFVGFRLVTKITKPGDKIPCTVVSY